MSTWNPVWTVIRASEGEGKLHALRPRSPRENIVRPMYLTTTLNTVMKLGVSVPDEKDRYNSLQADLEVFVTGQPITGSYLKPLEPKAEGVWEIRSKRPNPSVRVFGLFADRDVFIGTNLQLRSTLGSFNSIEWKEAHRLARFEFRQLGMEPRIGELHELVSGVLYV